MSVATEAEVEAGSFTQGVPVRRPARPVGLNRTGTRTGTVPRPGRVVRRGAGSRPAGLVTARTRGVPVSCAVRPIERPLVWLLLVGGLVLLAVLAFGWIAAAGDASATAPVAARTAMVQVGQGQTLWDIARRMDPGASTAAVVDRIQSLNGLSGGSVVPGQLLQVPLGN